MKNNKINTACTIPEISDGDIYQAMEEFSGYVDITPEDFKEIYFHAFQHAHQKLSGPERSKRAVAELSHPGEASEKITAFTSSSSKKQTLFRRYTPLAICMSLFRSGLVH